jgi:hypothetical protein
MAQRIGTGTLTLIAGVGLLSLLGRGLTTAQVTVSQFQ